jgi:hypothetical protein
MLTLYCNNSKFKIIFEQNLLITNNNYEFVKTNCIVNNNEYTLFLIVRYICPIYNFNLQTKYNPYLQKNIENIIQKYNEKPNINKPKTVYLSEESVNIFFPPQYRLFHEEAIFRNIYKIINRRNNNNNNNNNFLFDSIKKN